MRGILCAFVLCLFALPLSAAEITFDSNGYAPLADVLDPANYIDVGRFRWSDQSLTDFDFTPPATAIDTSGWQFRHGLYSHDGAVMNGSISTNNTGGSRSFTWTATVSKLAGGRQIGSVEVFAYNLGAQEWHQDMTVTGSSGVIGTVNAGSQLIPTQIYFDGQDEITIELQQGVTNGSYAQPSINIFPVAEAGTSVDLPAGTFVRDAVLGGTQVEGGIDFTLFNVLTPGTFSATLTTTPTSELSQEIINSLPFQLGDTFTSYEFDYSGDLALDDYIGLFIGAFRVKYDPETLGIPASSIRIFHHKDNGEWDVIVPSVYEELGIIAFTTNSFSSFAIGQFHVPEPACCWLILLGIPILRRKRKCQVTPDLS